MFEAIRGAKRTLLIPMRPSRGYLIPVSLGIAAREGRGEGEGRAGLKEERGGVQLLLPRGRKDGLGGMAARHRVDRYVSLDKSARWS